LRKGANIYDRALGLLLQQLLATRAFRWHLPSTPSALANGLVINRQASRRFLQGYFSAAGFLLALPFQQEHAVG
jgi:hypothetical protein